MFTNLFILVFCGEETGLDDSEGDILTVPVGEEFCDDCEGDVLTVTVGEEFCDDWYFELPSADAPPVVPEELELSGTTLIATEAELLDETLSLLELWLDSPVWTVQEDCPPVPPPGSPWSGSPFRSSLLTVVAGSRLRHSPLKTSLFSYSTSPAGRHSDASRRDQKQVLSNSSLPYGRQLTWLRKLGTLHLSMVIGMRMFWCAPTGGK